MGSEREPLESDRDLAPQGGLRHGALPLGRWGGVTIESHWSALVVLGLFVIVLAGTVLPEGHPGATPATYWGTGVVVAVVFFATLAAHELAHALVARHFGVEVERITLWLLGGVTQLRGANPTPRADALIAGAGPATSLAIGAVAGLLGWWIGGSSLLGTAILWLALVNVLLGVFNLLPGAPLDGGRLLRAVVWWRSGDRLRAELVATRTGWALGMGLGLLGILQALAGAPAGLWLILLGWFIMSGARAEAEAIGVEHLAGVPATELMQPVTATADETLTVAQTVAEYAPTLTRNDALPVVGADGRLVGVVALHDLETVPPGDWHSTRIGDLVSRHGPPLLLGGDEPGEGFAETIRYGGRIGVVVVDGRPVGVLTPGELARAAHLTLLGWRPRELRPAAGQRNPS